MRDDDLELLTKHAAHLPTAVDGNHEFVFTSQSVPEVPDMVRSDRIVITKSHRVVNGCWRCDNLDVHATRSTLRRLGLLVMAAVFFPVERVVELELTHPASAVTLLRIRAPWADPDLDTQPLSYTYTPSIPSRHPWAGDVLDPAGLPAFLLTDRTERGGTTDEEWAARDTVVGFGSPRATARLAAFLLDIGNPACTSDEFQLEGEAGIRGVAPLSAEASFWLPGSFGWEPSHGLE